MKYDINIGKVRGIQDSIWENIKKTYSFRKGFGAPLPIFGHYGGVFDVNGEKMVIHTDGVGTKLLVAQEVGVYDTVGIDAIAMSANDILCLGAETVCGVDYLAMAKEDDELVAEVMKGLVKGAEECDCAIIGGETAIVPDLIHGGEKPFDLAFTAVGRIRKMITGEKVKEGQVILGLESSGIHSNGYTLARKVLDVSVWGKEMLVPTKIYVKPVLELIDKLEISGIAHITGGSFSKITRLNKNVGYLLDKLPEPPEIFMEMAKKVPDKREMHRTFNMGVGLVVILDANEVPTAQSMLSKRGVKSHVIGKVVKEKGVFLGSLNGTRLD
ncbi:MAG: phosphoribosylformylglycinamidine cyclo-ligase [Candidatus Bilamarchaeaceae archaeon]